MLGALLLVMSTLAPTGQPGPMQPSDYTPAGPAQVVSWQLKRLPPPSPLYVTVDDVLRASAASSQANESITVSWRLLRASDGAIVYGQGTVAPGNNRAIVSQDFPLAEGFLLSVSCKAAVALTSGATFLRLFLNPKVLGAGQPGYMLMSDYVTTQVSSGFPNGRLLSPTEGPGGLTQVVVANPAAGADWIFTVPTNATWRIISISEVLVTSAVVANRVPKFRFNFSGGGRFFRTGNTARVTASSNLLIAAATGGAFVGDTLDSMQLSLPVGIRVRSGDLIASETLAIDGGDQYSQIVIRFEDYIENV